LICYFYQNIFAVFSADVWIDVGTVMMMMGNQVVVTRRLWKKNEQQQLMMPLKRLRSSNSMIGGVVGWTGGSSW
jgi:hypothetical protein